jgi:phosphoribosylaminoimidazolecarboxamide formyltransferase/IMP cyclohydrolase
VELLSTGGTAKALRDAGLAVKDVSEHTGFPEMMDGRVKTLHPKVHGGLLAARGIDDAVMAEHGIDAIDLLVLNLYPFAKVSMDPSSTFADVIENIDIGGPAMLRSAAKNFARVAVATDPAQYTGIVDELNASAGTLSAKTRFALAVAAFNNVAFYDACISNLPVRQAGGRQPCAVLRAGQRQFRQGDGPALRREPAPAGGVLPRPVAGTRLARHLHPVAGQGAQLQQHRRQRRRLGMRAPVRCAGLRHRQARQSLRRGGRRGLRRCLRARLCHRPDVGLRRHHRLQHDRSMRRRCKAILDRQFVEVLIAPDYEDGALEYARKKANVRVLRIPMAKPSPGFIDTKRVGSGLLMQTADDRVITRDDLKVVTKLAPTEAQFADLLFAWKVAKFVKSNAIVYAKENRTIGVGAGQMSRVYSARIAGIKAHDANLQVPKAR